MGKTARRFAEGETHMSLLLGVGDEVMSLLEGLVSVAAHDEVMLVVECADTA